MRLFSDFPFTLSCLALLSAVALWTSTHRENLTPHWMGRLGFAPRDIWLLRWDRVFTSAFVTHGRSVFWGAFGMTLFAVGAAEKMAGTLQAFAAFWICHILTLGLIALLIAWPLHAFKIPFGTTLTAAEDVGPSAGYFGCLGLLVSRISGIWKFAAAFIILAGLILYFFIPPSKGEPAITKQHADLAHILSFASGFSLAALGWFHLSSGGA